MILNKSRMCSDIRSRCAHIIIMCYAYEFIWGWTHFTRMCSLLSIAGFLHVVLPINFIFSFLYLKTYVDNNMNSLYGLFYQVRLSLL